MELFESVPNFPEGRRDEDISKIAAGAGAAFVLDVDPDPDHRRVVICLVGERPRVVEGLLGAIASAVERIDLRSHQGVHPRVGAADVVPIVPLGSTSLESCREVAHELGEQVWTELRLPVFFYGYGESKTLADIRAGRARPDLGGPDVHPTAGAVCVGARHLLVAFNVILFGHDMVPPRALPRSLRVPAPALPAAPALAFELPGSRVQLSMDLLRIDQTA